MYSLLSKFQQCFKALYVEASAEVFGLSSLYLLSRRWVRDPSGFRDRETRHTLGHAHDSVQMLKMLLKGKKKTTHNPPNQPKNPLAFVSRSSKSMQHLAFVLQSLGDKPACIHVPEVICFMLGICFA